jgi:hypothetical protein
MAFRLRQIMLSIAVQSSGSAIRATPESSIAQICGEITLKSFGVY